MRQILFFFFLESHWKDFNSWKTFCHPNSPMTNPLNLITEVPSTCFWRDQDSTNLAHQSVFTWYRNNQSLCSRLNRSSVVVLSSAYCPVAALRLITELSWDTRADGTLVQQRLRQSLVITTGRWHYSANAPFSSERMLEHSALPLLPGWTCRVVNLNWRS